MSTMKIIPADDRRWFEFLAGRRDALPYHHPGWARTLSDTYGFETFVLARQAAEGDVTAGIPFAAVGGGLRRKRWIALPFTDAMPPLSSNGGGGAVLAPLVEAAAKAADVSTVEIRAPFSAPVAHELTRGVGHTLALSDPDTLFASFPSRVRRAVRKAETSGLTVRLADGARDLTHVYFDLHAETRRRLGVPTQPRRFFEALWTHMVDPGLGFVLLAYHDSQPVAGAVFLEWHGSTVYKFGASAQRFWPLRPNNLILWEAMQRACASGSQELDFGRSDLEDEGLRAFKASWGAVERPLVYTRLGRGREGQGQSAERLLRPVVRHSPIWFGRLLGEALYRFAA